MEGAGSEADSVFLECVRGGIVGFFYLLRSGDSPISDGMHSDFTNVLVRNSFFGGSSFYL